MRVINEIQTLETRKIELDEKRKYAIEVGTREEKAEADAVVIGRSAL